MQKDSAASKRQSPFYKDRECSEKHCKKSPAPQNNLEIIKQGFVKLAIICSVFSCKSHSLARMTVELTR